VLIVEDNEKYREIVCQALARRLVGYEILGASGVAEARATAANRTIDVLVTDMALPDGTGIELIESLSRSATKTLKAVMFSNYSQEELSLNLSQCGISSFVGKEQGIRALAAAIEEAGGPI